MNWRVVVGDREIPIDLAKLPDLREVEPGVYSVLLDGRSLLFRVAPVEGAVLVNVKGREYRVEARDPRAGARHGRHTLGEGRQNICAPMPGKVIRVLAAEGDAVQHGQGLAVVEAMKMQNEVKAPRDGRVIAIRAKAGDAVTAGAVLVTIE
jgi:biotin carboxyl carrier protein